MDVKGQKEGATGRVAVIGAGTMGGAMASRLLESGAEVAVWSRHQESTAPVVDRGATAFGHSAEAAGAADIVLTTLPNIEATEAVMFDEKALVATRANATWVQMATIGVAATRRLQARAADERPDVIFVDAPVSGSRQPAETGQLLILASGPPEAGERLQSVFDVLGKKTLWLGPAGAGSAMKLVLNTLLAFETEGAAESAALAEHLGVDAQSLVEAISSTPLASGYGLLKLQKMLAKDDSADFSLEWALKDLDLGSTDAGSGSAPVARAIADRWRGLVNAGSGRLDVSAERLGLDERL